MGLKIRLSAFIVLMSLAGYIHAVAQPKAKIPRVLILLDGSSSMNEDWNGGGSRFREAGRFILGLMDSMTAANETVEFGLRVFGHQYPAQQRNCYDTKREVPFFLGNRTQMQSRLESLHGYGVSPIAYALSEAATEDFGNEDKYAYSIVLVTDGGESCDGDICKVVQELLKRKVFFRPYIVSLADYAPLKDLYACLGTFLTVSKETEAPVAISRIVDAHREGFERAKTGKTIPVFDKDTVPVVARVVEKPVIKPVEKPKDTVPVKVETKPVIKPVERPKDTLTVPLKVVEKPQIRDRRVINPLTLSQRLKVFMSVIREIPGNPLPVKVPAFVLAKLDLPVPVTPVVVPERKKEKVFAQLRPAPRKGMMQVLFTIPSPRKLAVPAFALTKMEAAPPVTPTPPVVTKPKEPVKTTAIPDKPDTKTAPYTAQKEAAAETLLEVYFTDGMGKFYSSMPQILLTDPATGKQAQKFYRTVNPDGNPDPQKIPAGTYNLSVVGSDRTFLKDVVISPNMKNKVIITVSNGSLKFAYSGKNGKKPVDKYYAIVKRNFEPLPVVKQRCDTQLYYPPGNYHIEVNTLPASSYSVDMSFGVTILLPVAEPGTVVFSNSNRLGKIRLFYPLGDKFVQFYTMDIAGNPSMQTVELKPGIYQVYYALAPGMPERVLTFHIRSEETVTIELK